MATKYTMMMKDLVSIELQILSSCLKNQSLNFEK
nr:MAG TPA: hypothetical protein [Caudoviricetes sp.]